MKDLSKTKKPHGSYLSQRNIFVLLGFVFFSAPNLFAEEASVDNNKYYQMRARDFPSLSEYEKISAIKALTLSNFRKINTKEAEEVAQCITRASAVPIWRKQILGTLIIKCMRTLKSSSEEEGDIQEQAPI